MTEKKTDKYKKITAAASVAVVTFVFFFWLGFGMINTAGDALGSVWPMLFIYAAFPVLACIVSVRRIKELFRISEEDKIKAEENSAAEDAGTQGK